MTQEALINAFCYELAIWAVAKWPKLAFAPWMQALLAWCKTDWAAWKTEQTIKKVDQQAALLVEQWEKSERTQHAEALVQKAQEMFPQATVKPLPDAIVPSIMIIHEPPAGASDEVKALGGEIRITYQLK